MGKKRREKRDADSFLSVARSYINAAPVTAVSAHMAENLSAVLACVQAIASAIASLPCYVYRVSSTGRTIDNQHPLQTLIRRGPNEHQSWPDYVEWLIASILLRGNGFSEIVTDSSGQLQELRPYPWEQVSAQLLGTGRLIYDVTESASIYGGTGQSRRLIQDEALHVRDRSDDGLIGRSRLQRAARVISTANDTQQFAFNSYHNGMRPSGVVTHPGKLSDVGYKRLTGDLNANFFGIEKAGSTPIFEEGMKYEAITITPEDAELLASRRFSTEELARIYQVPPPLIGDLSNGTFTNSETAGRWFAQHTLRPWVRKLEAVMSRAVFTQAELQTHLIEFDLSDLLRGDPETRWKSHQIAVDSGILTPNEVREIEGWNPRPDGNDLRPKTTSALPAPGTDQSQEA